MHIYIYTPACCVPGAYCQRHHHQIDFFKHLFREPEWFFGIDIFGFVMVNFRFGGRPRNRFLKPKSTGTAELRSQNITRFHCLGFLFVLEKEWFQQLAQTWAPTYSELDGYKNFTSPTDSSPICKHHSSKNRKQKKERIDENFLIEYVQVVLFMKEKQRNKARKKSNKKEAKKKERKKTRKEGRKK